MMAADQLEKTCELLTLARSLHTDVWLTFDGTEFVSGASGGGGGALEVESRSSLQPEEAARASSSADQPPSSSSRVQICDVINTRA